MLGNDIGGKIRGAVFALVAGIVILYLVPVNFAAADSLNREFYDHCKFGSESARRAQLTGVSGDISTVPAAALGKVYTLTNNNGSCQLPVNSGDNVATGAKAATSTQWELTLDNGTIFTVAGSVADKVGWAATNVTIGGQTGVWTIPGPVMSRFSGINRLVTSILPVLITIGLFAVVGFGAAKMWKGESLGESIGIEVGIVIVVVVVMNLAPSMFEAIGEGATANAGQYGVTAQFNGITDLLFGLLPLLVVLSLIGLLAWRGYSGFKSMTKGDGALQMG